MSLTKDDLDKISANTQAIVDLAVAKLEQKIDQRISLLEHSLMAEIRQLHEEIGEIKRMMIEDTAAANEGIDELEARVKKLEGQVAALA